MYQNKKENIASPKMIKATIKKYYDSIPDEEPSPVIGDILRRNIPIEELNQPFPTPQQLLEDSLKDFEELESKLEEITYLSCILDDPNVRFHSEEAYEKCVNYLLTNAPDILLEVSSLLRWLYNERTYGTPAIKKKNASSE